MKDIKEHNGAGINTVRIDGEVKHILDLDEQTLCSEWSKLKRENNELYQINGQANSGWRGLILRLIGVVLPDKRVSICGVNAKGESIYPE